MVIKVDLGCEKCHKKIKRVLCAIPRESFFFSLKTVLGLSCFYYLRKWLSFVDLMMLINEQEKSRTRHMTRRKTQWQSLWCVAVLKRSRKKYTAKEVELSSALRSSRLRRKNQSQKKNQNQKKTHHHHHHHLLLLLLLHHHHHHHHAHAVKNAAEAHIVITFVCQQYLHIVMYLVEGQSVIYGEMVVVVAEVEVAMCAEVYMFMKSTTIPRHAKACKGKSS